MSTISVRGSTAEAAAGAGTTQLQSGSFSTDPVTGDAVVVLIALGDLNNTVNTVTDTSGNTYVQDGSIANGANIAAIWRATNITNSQGAGLFKVTVKPTNAGYTSFTAIALTPSPAGNVVKDGTGSTNTGTNGGGSPSTGTVVTSDSRGGIILATFADGACGSITVPAGFTRIAQEMSNGTFEDQDSVYELTTLVFNGNVSWSAISGGSAATKWAAIGQGYTQQSLGGTDTYPAYDPLRWRFEDDLEEILFG
jgi:hypothetical protein